MRGRGGLALRNLTFFGVEGASRFGTLFGVEGALRFGTLRSAHTRGHVAGACCGDRFLEVFTRRVLSQGHIVISFSEWFIFLKCCGEMSHEHFTQGDLACNRGVTLFCRRDMSPQFKMIPILGECRADKISSPQQDCS